MIKDFPHIEDVKDVDKDVKDVDKDVKDVDNLDKGSVWFQRLVKDLKRISKHFKIKKIKMGFYRIYYRDAYVHEVYKDMPARGYTWYTESPYKDNLRLLLDYEQDGEIQRKIKNYVEGYYESIKAIKLRLYQFRNNKEHYKLAREMYQQVVVK